MPVNTGIGLLQWLILFLRLGRCITAAAARAVVMEGFASVSEVFLSINTDEKGPIFQISFKNRASTSECGEYSCNR
jgi:hypothetical protein